MWNIHVRLAKLFNSAVEVIKCDFFITLLNMKVQSVSQQKRYPQHVVTSDSTDKILKIILYYDIMPLDSVVKKCLRRVQYINIGIVGFGPRCEPQKLSLSTFCRILSVNFPYSFFLTMFPGNTWKRTSTLLCCGYTFT